MRIRTDVTLLPEDAEASLTAPQDSTGIRISTLKFYISSIQLLKDKKIIYSESNSYHLIDFADTNTCFLQFEKSFFKKANQIQFNLGIDSTTNVSGAMGGDLDPIKGMYWTWLSGYINLKFEGSINSGAGKNQKFEYHLGGYSFPYASLQMIQLPLKKNSSPTLYFKLKTVLPLLLASGKTHIMSPGPASQRISILLSKCFTLE